MIIKARTHGATFLATLRATVGSSSTSATVARNVASCDTPKKTCCAQRYKKSCIVCLGLNSSNVIVTNWKTRSLFKPWKCPKHFNVQRISNEFQRSEERARVEFPKNFQGLGALVSSV